MSNLKLYKGINNIDDDLIEEADCKGKPVIHHCYGVAASAAAIFIAVGALGIFHTANPDKKPVLSGNDAVIEQSTVEITTTLPLISDEIIQTSSVQTSSQTSQCTETTTQFSLSYSKTSAIQKNSHIQTTTMPAITVTQTSSAGDETGTATASNITTTVPEYDYEYEGSIIMKKYAAALAALITASSTANILPAQAAEYRFEVSPTASSVKKFIDEYNVDLDINSDGNFDLFDIYAMFRCEWERIDQVPDYIREKYESLTRKKKNDNGEMVHIGGFDFYQEPFYLNWKDLANYYFTYHSLKLEYFDPNYYIDNCPDVYVENVPLDVVKQEIKDIDIWTNEKFGKTKNYIKKDDGTFRSFTTEDIDDAYYYNEEEGKYVADNNYFNYYPSIYRFICECHNYSVPDYYQTDALMLDILNSGYVDVDINSDGVFDFDDIVLVAYYINTYEAEEIDKREQFYYCIASQPIGSYFKNYPAELRESPDNPITEKEWNKVRDFLDVVRYYYKSDFNIIRYLAEDYLIKNEVDTKYFDPVYYEKNHFAHYEYDDNFLYTVNCKDGLLFNYLGLFEKFSLQYGPSAEKYRDLFKTEENQEIIYYDDAINEIFPVYYKNVKTGVIPEPDIDLDGTISISDYIILDTISSYYVSIDETDSLAPFIRRHPEVKANINLSKEALDNYQNNFDFNNSGIIGDYFECDCMRIYIYNELVKQYGDEEAVSNMISDYGKEHSELWYNRISYEKMEEFVKNNGVGFTKRNEEDYEGTTEDTAETDEITEDSSSDIKVYYAPEDIEGMKGDSNVDRIVDISDSVLIMQSLANPSKYGLNGSDENHITEEGYLLADVDGDGVTTNDALTIQKSLLR